MPKEISFEDLKRMLKESPGRKRLLYIIEHREEDPIPPTGLSEGENFDAYMTIIWSHDRGTRTTTFRPSFWKVMTVPSTDIIFLVRQKPNERKGDLPWPSANLYTLVLTDHPRR